MNNHTYYNNGGSNPYAGQRCARCGVPFTVTDEVMVCDTCGAPHHRQCWEDGNKCCVPGCTGRIDEKASLVISTAQPSHPTVPPPQVQNMPQAQVQQTAKKPVLNTWLIGAVAALAIILLTVGVLFASKVLCIHKWEKATCQTAETCVRCAKQRGETGRHDWVEADCENPEKCSICGETNGEPVGHSWKAATETSPRICSICNKSDGKPLAEVPDVIDMEYTEAQQKLAVIGFDVEIEYNYSADVKDGYVMGQSLLGGEMAEQDATITLIVSQGKEVVECPEEYEQKLEVVSSGSSAVLTLYEWDSEWVSVWSADGYVGMDGVSSDRSENSCTTPKGTFPIGFAYGLSKPDTNLDFEELTSSSVWVDDSSSPYYNVLTTYSKADGAHYEDTYQQFVDGYFSTNIYFENNGDGLTKNSATPGKGSVITICGYNRTLGPTYGCVDISSSDMSSLLKHLDKDKNPVVIIS